MALILGRLKCCFCGHKKGVLHSVHAYGIYENDLGKRYFYHPECLELVEMSPEKHGHKKMDLALEINDRRKENLRKTNEKIIPDFKEKVDQLHTNHFERMMPSK